MSTHLLRFPAFALVLFLTGTASASLPPGHILVADQTGAAIIVVDPGTGVQTILSSGGYFQNPSGIAIESSGSIVVSDRGGHRLIRVNTSDGTQTLLTSDGYLHDPANIAVLSNGDIIVVDTDGFGGPGGVIRVDPVTGNQTPVSSGDNFVVAGGIAVEADDTFLVGDRGPQATGNDGQLIRVNPITGAQTLFVTGGLLWNPDHLAIAQNGDIFVADHDAPDGTGQITRVDPVTGAQSVISSGGYFEGGPSGIAFADDGTLFVSDHHAIDGNGGIFQIDLTTGQQTVVSSGGYFIDPVGIIVVPEPSVGLLAAVALIGLATVKRRL